jgi:hypothetical protein
MRSFGDQQRYLPETIGADPEQAAGNGHNAERDRRKLRPLARLAFVDFRCELKR